MMRLRAFLCCAVIGFGLALLLSGRASGTCRPHTDDSNLRGPIAKLAPRIAEDREFNDLRVNPRELPDGGVSFRRKGNS